MLGLKAYEPQGERNRQKVDVRLWKERFWGEDGHSKRTKVAQEYESDARDIAKVCKK